MNFLDIHVLNINHKLGDNISQTWLSNDLSLQGWKIYNLDIQFNRTLTYSLNILFYNNFGIK